MGADCEEEKEELRCTSDALPDLDADTKKCLRQLQLAQCVSCKELLRIINGNDAACEVDRLRCEAGTAALRGPVSELRAALSRRGRAGNTVPVQKKQVETEPTFGLFGDWFGSWSATGQPSQDTLVSTRGRASRAAPGDLADFNSSLEQLERGPDLAAQSGMRLLQTAEELQLRLEHLRRGWPQLRRAVQRSHETGLPLATAELSHALQEAMSCRRGLRRTLGAAVEAVEAQLRDGIDKLGGDLEEDLRWRSKSRAVLDGLDKALAARTAAVLWLHGPQGSPKPPDVATEVAERCLEAVELLDQRLVKCASSIMRSETDVAIVQRSTRRLLPARTIACCWRRGGSSEARRADLRGVLAGGREGGGQHRLPQVPRGC